MQQGKDYFRTSYKHFEYTFMSLGLTNMEIVFQHIANDIFWNFLYIAIV